MLNTLLRSIVVSSAIVSACVAGPATTAPDANVDQLAAELSSPSLPTRRGAAEKLGRIGAPATAAVPALIKALDDGDDLMRRNAAWALGKIKEPHAVIVPALIARLNAVEEEWSVRHNVALSLSWIGKPAEKPLRELLNAKVAWTRAYAADALLRTRDETADAALLAAVQKLFADETAGIPAFAATLAGRIGEDAGPTVPALAALLEKGDVPSRINAVQALTRIGKNAAPALPQIRHAVRNDSEQWVRINATQALVAAGEDDPQTVPTLIATFSDSKDRVGSYAVQALVRCGKGAVPALRAALRSEERRTRLFAAESLAFIGERAEGEADATRKSLLPVLAGDTDWEVRSLAASALGSLGKADDAVVRQLEKALHDEHEIVRLNAGDALKKLGHSSASAPGGAAKEPATTAGPTRRQT